MKTLETLDVAGKRVIVRADLNVSFRENGSIADDFRIAAFVPTIRFLQDQKATALVFSHLGRPGGKPDAHLTLKPVAEHLAQLLASPVRFIDDIAGDKAEHAVKSAKSGDILLFENLRFDPGEEANDLVFAKKLARFGDYYVNDAFGVSHRTHASIVLLPQLLASAAGLLLIREIATLTNLRDNPDRPMTVILGGAKISTKLPIIKRMLPRTDALCLGGALANTVLLAKGIGVGKSVVEKAMVDEVRDMALTDTKLHLPLDVVVAEGPHAASVHIKGAGSVHEHEMILDIGPDTVALFRNVAKKSKTVFWNGPLGWTEMPAFAKGTEEIAKALGEAGNFTVAGGGDLTVILARLGLIDRFTFVSTGGGAMLAFLAGEELPGIKALAG